jgi:hypothetical protein
MLKQLMHIFTTVLETVKETVVLYNKCQSFGKFNSASMKTGFGHANETEPPWCKISSIHESAATF